MARADVERTGRRTLSTCQSRPVEAMDSQAEHPNGSVQAISSAAMSMFALLVAFVGFTAFDSGGMDAPWRRIDIVDLVFALLAAINLSIVPWIVTRTQRHEAVGHSVELARLFFAVGAVFTELSILSYMVLDFLAA